MLAACEKDCHKREMLLPLIVMSSLHSSVWDDDIDAIHGHPPKWLSHWQGPSLRFLIWFASATWQMKMVWLKTPQLESLKLTRVFRRSHMPKEIMLVWGKLMLIFVLIDVHVFDNKDRHNYYCHNKNTRSEVLLHSLLYISKMEPIILISQLKMFTQ